MTFSDIEDNDLVSDSVDAVINDPVSEMDEIRSAVEEIISNE